MSWQDDAMIEQEVADALNYMGEAEWRDMYGEDRLDKKIAEEKKKRSEYNAKYWAANRERISKKRKENYEKDPSKILERNKRWLENNREHWNAYQREYRRRQRSIDKADNV